jgi:hypothetical protein
MKFDWHPRSRTLAACLILSLVLGTNAVQKVDHGLVDNLSYASPFPKVSGLAAKFPKEAVERILSHEFKAPPLKIRFAQGVTSGGMLTEMMPVQI